MKPYIVYQELYHIHVQMSQQAENTVALVLNVLVPLYQYFVRGLHVLLP